MKKIIIYRNPLKRNILGGFILDINEKERLKSKRDSALEILKLWEEELEIKNQISNVESKKKNVDQKFDGMHS